MPFANSHFVGWTAIAGGIIGIIGFVALMLLFTVGEPFGTINDVLAIPSGLLLLPLVFALYRLHAAEHSVAGLVGLLAGVTGFVATATGSILLIAGRIDFVQSLLPGLGGFGLIGLWVLINSGLGLVEDTMPRAAALAGVLLGITPTLALLTIFNVNNVANTLTNMGGGTAGFQMSPLMTIIVVLGMVSYAGLPVWFILMGRLLLANRVGVLAGSAVVF